MTEQQPVPPRLAEIYGAKRQEELAQRAQATPQPAPASAPAAPQQPRPLTLADAWSIHKQQQAGGKA